MKKENKIKNIDSEIKSFQKSPSSRPWTIFYLVIKLNLWS